MIHIKYLFLKILVLLLRLCEAAAQGDTRQLELLVEADRRSAGFLGDNPEGNRSKRLTFRIHQHSVIDVLST